MDSADVYRALADAVLVIHFLIVAFIVLGFGAILVGRWRSWPWVFNRTFRNTHLAAIVFVAIQAWFGKICALTTLEGALRQKTGQAAYAETFIQHWLHRLLFFEAPLWIFTTLYSIFGLLVLFTWWRDRHRFAGDSRQRESNHA